MRLVDAHKLYEQYETAMRELVKSTNCENVSLEALSLLCGAKLIADAPTVDAAPVKHGKWIMMGGMKPPEYHHHHQCSVCEAYAPMQAPYGFKEALTPWCPGCGAKMDLEE